MSGSVTDCHLRFLRPLHPTISSTVMSALQCGPVGLRMRSTINLVAIHFCSLPTSQLVKHRGKELTYTLGCL